MFERKYGNIYKMNIFEFVWLRLRMWFKYNFNPFASRTRVEIMRNICYFYSERNGFKSRKVVSSELSSLGIIRVWYSFGAIHISLRSPGLIIGKRGENINALFEHLKKNWKYHLFPLRRIKVHVYRECEIGLDAWVFDDDPEEEDPDDWRF